MHQCLELQLQGGWTSLMWTCYKGWTEVAEVLLNNHANPSVKGEVCQAPSLSFAAFCHSDMIIVSSSITCHA